jgi:PAS domain S-box-containing protein
VAVEPAQAYLQSIVDTVREPLLVLDARLQVVSANRAFYRSFRTSAQETLGRRIYELGSRQWDIPALRQLLEEILPGNSHFDDFPVEHDFPGIGHRTMLLNARKLFRPGNGTEMLLLAMEDVTERLRAEAERAGALEALRASTEALRAAFERERRIAEALQRPLTLEIAQDAFPGVSLASLYEAASPEAEAGGDFFDVFALPQNRIALYVGDVSGKGLAAAARCAQVKDVLRALVRESPLQPGRALSRLNDFLCGTKALDEAGEGTFITLALVVMDPATGMTVLSCAGSEPPLVVRADARAEAGRAGGSPLGMFPDQRYAESALHLEAGDTLLLVTDGLTEARAPRAPGSRAPETDTEAGARRVGSFLGSEGVRELARQGRAAPSLRGMGLAVLDGARDFAGGMLHDDACLLLVRRR